MKKINVIFVLISLIGLFATSCVKENIQENTNENIGQKANHVAKARKINTEKESTNPGDVYVASYELSSTVGHNSSDCAGSCTMVGGVYCHVNCQGYGTTCASTAAVRVTRNPGKSSSYEAITLDDYGPTDELTFNMPARSFYIEDMDFDNGYIWLNIPAQQLVRNNIHQSFHYENLSFTTQALYLNL